MRRMHTDEEIKALALNVDAASIAALGISKTEDGLNVDGELTADEIVENMEGYSFAAEPSSENFSLNVLYAGACKNGNKLTLSVIVEATPLNENKAANGNFALGSFTIPSSIGGKLIPSNIGTTSALSVGLSPLFRNYVNGYDEASYLVQKFSNTSIRVVIYNKAQMTAGTKYTARVESTFLLGENLATQE